jgi:hypothetical protein
MELMQANRQWSTRPADERFTSLTAMFDHFQHQRDRSRELVVSTRKLQVIPDQDNKGLSLVGQSGVPYSPTHWAFGQLAARAEAPAGYLRTIPSPIAADCLNYGLLTRNVEDVGLLLHRNGDSTARAVTGPRYGRIWNVDVLSALHKTVGDGINGDWRVPGEFGKAVTVTKDNTTLFAGDRDFFVFLADEQHKIEVPNQRGANSALGRGLPMRPMSRGFFVWNSEVGSATFGIATFLFDYVCCNRIVWGAQEYKQLKIRHTVSAPDRFLEEIQPALVTYSQGSAKTVVEAVTKAQAARLEPDKVDAFLSQRFGARMVAKLQAVHNLEEGRPIETLWDVTTAATALARSIPYQNDRVELERQAGDIMALAA